MSLAPPASAEEELRIKIDGGAAEVRLQGKDLAFFDGLSGERIGTAAGKAVIRVRRRGKRVTAVGRLEPKRVTASSLLVESDGGIRVGKRLFLGRISVRPQGRRSLLVINRIPLETYILGIVGSEMSPAWPAEALKAQAVAARTYGMQRRMRMRAANKAYDLESTVLSQVYTGADRIKPSVVKAVLATRGEVLSYRHRLAESLFHSTCGGRTASSASAFKSRIPYLDSRPCGWCRPSNRYRWSVVMDVAEVSEKLNKGRAIKGKLTKLSRAAGMKRAALVVNGKRVSLHPKLIRKTLGFGELYSTHFSASTVGREIRFTGRGFGHRVGMCQWGAKGLADRGSSYRDILGHYYKGTQIRRIY